MSEQLNRNQNILKKYIPEMAVPIVSEWIYRYDFKLKIKKSRATKLGDYRPPVNGNNHQITINHDMNRYAFFITLIHEVAHLDNYLKYKNTVKPHGEEWKNSYKKLMTPFLNTDYFPEDIIRVLQAYMSNPAASSCSDIELLRTLKKYDKPSSSLLVEEITHGATFIYNNRKFVKIEKSRKRYKCMEIETKAVYLFNPLTEVEKHIDG
jgi:SprT protein